MPDALLRATSLRHAFDLAESPLFDLPELTIAAGCHAAVVGPSGCGKTTLLRLLTGILTPTAGTIELDGHRLDKLGEARRRAIRISTVGFVFQRFALLDYCTALENILLPLRLHRSVALDAEARHRARELATRAGIAHTLKRRPDRLSQGEQQRVAICRALITNPKLIACDEPTGNLDPARAASIMDLILEQAEHTGATVLLVTHDHALLPRFEHVLDMGTLAREAATA
ncbi:MAG: ABC transporter ATP-binding protein [Phycisphaerales bacterium JB060]